ncbi:MAG TPA: hypothetical protein VGI39_19260, partial [Polyangiaceae bacterium]
ELGGSIGTAWMSTHLDWMTKQYLVDLSPNVDAFHSAAQEQLRAAQAGVGARMWDSFGTALSVMQARINLQALVRAFNEGFSTLALAFLLSLAVVFLLRKPKENVVVEGAH